MVNPVVEAGGVVWEVGGGLEPEGGAYLLVGQEGEEHHQDGQRRL